MITIGVHITSTANGILFVTNDYAPLIGFEKTFRLKSSLARIQQKTEWVTAETLDGQQFNFTNVLDPLNTNIVWVEEFDGVPCATIGELFDKFQAIFG
jgi:hypothetical protein